MKVAVYSGSFNPFHKGHLAVVRYLLDAAGFDRVYLIVSPRNPFKPASISGTASSRLSAVRDAIARNALSGSVLVDDIEFHMPLPSYTINTLDALAAREPENSFTLVVGGDNLLQLPNWRQGERILREYGVVVYPREGFDLRKDEAELRRRYAGGGVPAGSGDNYAPSCGLKIRTLDDAPLVTVSSTQIREMISRGEDVSSLLA